MKGPLGHTYSQNMKVIESAPMSKFEIHEATCPRLYEGFLECNCAGPSLVAVDRAALEELVEAGAAYTKYDPTGRDKRMVAALQPFRRGEKTP